MQCVPTNLKKDLQKNRNKQNKKYTRIDKNQVDKPNIVQKIKNPKRKVKYIEAAVWCREKA